MQNTPNPFQDEQTKLSDSHKPSLSDDQKSEKVSTHATFSQAKKPAIKSDSTVTRYIVNEPETVKQFGQTYNIYKRERLYKEIWSAPVTEIAKQYKVSDATIHKVCKALDIPKPPPGHWAKLRAGKKTAIIPLPQSDKPSQKLGVQTGVTYQPKKEKETLAFLSNEARSTIITAASQVLLPDENARMHSKIIAYRKTIAEWKKQQKNAQNKTWARHNTDSIPFLLQSISNDMLSRVYRIIGALIKAIEPLGCSLTSDLNFIINNETVELSFSESKNKVPHLLTKEENKQLLKYEEDIKRYLWGSKPQIRKHDYIYNGTLTVNINGQKGFRDCKSYVVEDRLGDIIIEMYEAAEVNKKARITREEAERKRIEEQQHKEERRKNYNIEVDRTLTLTNLAEDYDTACKIRKYISAVESSGAFDPEAVEWIEWAKAKADWYDPTVAKEDNFLGKREHTEPEDKKKLRHLNYWH